MRCGVPASPRAGIIQAARHKAIDRIRRPARFEQKLHIYADAKMAPAQTAAATKEHETLIPRRRPITRPRRARR